MGMPERLVELQVGLGALWKRVERFDPSADVDAVLFLDRIRSNFLETAAPVIAGLESNHGVSDADQSPIKTALKLNELLGPSVRVTTDQPQAFRAIMEVRRVLFEDVKVLSLSPLPSRSASVDVTETSLPHFSSSSMETSSVCDPPLVFGVSFGVDSNS